MGKLTSLFVIVLGLGLVSCDTSPQEAPAAPLEPVPVASAVTVYNGGRALVKDTRRFPMTAGTQAVRFDDVTSGIIPGSVHVNAAEGGVHVREQNFEYDLVSTDKLLQRYLGEPIRVTTESGEVHAGVLLSGARDVILETEAGGVTVLRLDQIRDVTFPELPEGLASKPSLLWSMEAEQAGDQELTVTYLTGGFGWQADYIVRLGDDDDSVDLAGWVSVTNDSEATFHDAHLKLVAGDVNMVPIPDASCADEMDASKARRSAEYEAAGPQQREFFDYHLYEMPRPVTLRSHETKQVEFLSASEIPAEVTYRLEYDGHWYGTTVTRHPSVNVELVNGVEQNLGVPLPMGVVRVYKQDVDGAAELVGESRIEHTPTDERVELRVGDAFDIVGEWRRTRQREISWSTYDVSYEAVVRNHKDTDVTVELLQHPYAWGDWSVRKASHTSERQDNNTLTFDVAVPAHGETTVTYTIRNRW
jgi:hypothetical protein